MKKFTAVKRSINNDYDITECEKYDINTFNSREEAVNWLLSKYEYEHEDGLFRDSADFYQSDEFKEIRAFFMQVPNDDALFQWEWKRRGNCRTYKIIEHDEGELHFYAKGKTLFKLKNGKVVAKTAKK